MSGPSPLKSPLAQEIEPRVDPRVGTVLADRYRIDALLGEGGMGRVYGAEHVLMRKRLAVKVLHRELTTVPEVVQRFEREAMAAANIDHPNVAAATDFGKLADGAVFLVLEYVQGKNLRDEIAAGPLTVERALHIGRQIASALASAHALDIVHRDLKPENVMLVEKGGEQDFVKVLDFGIAKVPIGEVSASQSRPNAPITKVGMVFGTPEYMAPEQALGQVVDGRADIYALGVIVYEMISGVRPFSSKSQVGILGQQLSKPPPSFSERAPGIAVSPPVEHVILRMLAKDSSDRFQSAWEVVEAIDALLGAPLTKGGRKFTQFSGSPNSARSSNPNLGRAPLGSNPHLGRSPLGSAPQISPEIRVASLDSGAESGRFPSRSGAPESRSGSRIPVTVTDAPDESAALGSPPLAGGTMPMLHPPEQFAGAGFDDDTELAPRPNAWQRLLAWTDRRRLALPKPLGAALRDVPPIGLLVGAAFAVVGVLLALALTIGALSRSRSTIAASKPAPGVTAPAPSAATQTVSAEPTQAELETARAAGAAGLEELATRYPKQPRLLLELIKAYDDKGEHAQAVGAIGRALSVSQELRDDALVATVLFKAAQAKGSSDASFALLQGPMGSRGADIVYDLATTQGVRASIKQRADAWLGTRDFDRASSAALNIAASLRHADSCQQKHALLLRAKNVGDERSLPYLRELEGKAGCGRRHRDDCYPCLRKDERLKEAISAIKERTKSG